MYKSLQNTLMNHTFTFILLLMLLLGQSFAPKADNRLILWGREVKLTWEDFQGNFDVNVARKNPLEQDKVIEEEGRRTLTHTEMDAYCFHQISFASRYAGDSMTFEVKTMFDKSKSWKNTNSEYILNHEQRHFDLGEVYARKFRKYLFDSVNTFNAAAQNKMFNLFLEEDNEVQRQYDSVSNHSINQNGQLEWNIRIDSLLNAYADFADPIVKKHNIQIKKKR